MEVSRKKISILSFFLLFINLSVYCQTAGKIETKNSIVHFNGVYSMEYGLIAIQYIRFFEGGTVLTIGTLKSDKEDSKILLDKESKDIRISKGEYSIEKNIIKFTTKSEFVTVDYIGAINGDKILFTVYSQTTKHQSEDEYTFRAILDYTKTIL